MSSNENPKPIAFPTLSYREGDLIDVALQHYGQELHKGGSKMIPQVIYELRCKFSYPSDHYGCDPEYDSFAEIEEREQKIKRRIYDPSELYPGEDEVYEFYIVQT